MREKSQLTTLCYIETSEKYLMLHRVSKKNDVNKDKWIGVGGHFEINESPEDCLLREVWEENGAQAYFLPLPRVVTFHFEKADKSFSETEYMCLYTADGDEGELTECNEGVLEWVDKKELSLKLWEGDKIFFRLLEENRPFFSLKLSYVEDELKEAVLDGRALDL